MIDTLTLPLRLTLEAARQGTLTLDQVRDTLETWPALLQDERCEQAEARFLMSLLTWEAGDSL